MALTRAQEELIIKDYIQPYIDSIPNKALNDEPDLYLPRNADLDKSLARLFSLLQYAYSRNKVDGTPVLQQLTLARNRLSPQELRLYMLYLDEATQYNVLPACSVAALQTFIREYLFNLLCPEYLKDLAPGAVNHRWSVLNGAKPQKYLPQLFPPRQAAPEIFYVISDRKVQVTHDGESMLPGTSDPYRKQIPDLEILKSLFDSPFETVRLYPSLYQALEAASLETDIYHGRVPSIWAVHYNKDASKLTFIAEEDRINRRRCSSNSFENCERAVLLQSVPEVDLSDVTPIAGSVAHLTGFNSYGLSNILDSAAIQRYREHPHNNQKESNCRLI